MYVQKVNIKNLSKNKLVLESLASDSKRVSIGIQRNSFAMTDRFCEEALKRKNEVDTQTVPEYIN